MPKLLTAIAILAALVLLATSATVNFLFTSSLGRTPTEGLVLGALSVGVDILKSVLCVALAHAARQQRWGFVAVGSCAFIVFTAFSMVSALGFTAANRSAVTGVRENQNTRLAGVEAKLGELRGKLKALPAHRPLAILDESLAVAKGDARWSATKQCAAAQAAAKEFCQNLGQLRTERAAALEASRIEELIAAQEAEAERLRGQGGGEASDPQALALARALGVGEAQVQRALMAMLSVVLEIGAGLGIWLALGASVAKKPDVQEKPAAAAASPQADEIEASKAVEEAIEPASSEPAQPAAAAALVETPRPGIMVSVRTPPARPARRNGVKPPTEST